MDFENYIEQCVVKLLTHGNKVNGTGFWVLPDGSCLTCFHILKEEKNLENIEIEYKGEKLQVCFDYKLSNPEKDIAVLKLKDQEKDQIKSFSFVPLGVPIMDSEVRFYGYRKGFSKGYMITATLRPGQEIGAMGKVLNLETNQPDKTTVGGMSGAPVFDRRQKVVVGIQWSEEEAGPAICYAHPIEKSYESWPELREKNKQASKQAFKDLYISQTESECVNARIAIRKDNELGDVLFENNAAVVRIGKNLDNNIILGQPASGEHGRILLASGTYVYQHLGKHSAILKRKTGKKIILKQCQEETLHQLDKIIFLPDFAISVRFELPDISDYEPTDELPIPTEEFLENS